ncbi:hypothetical protein GX51_08332 [Blastomyces parvus]|uniref:Uncharacterized protein n=1 Tax=Blastomyces parvus TaxID=2060905 RepID=A0A2B7WEH3_9EURO|nr:hypothetical protein GX51_08332 [Blastomyces parvus]
MLTLNELLQFNFSIHVSNTDQSSYHQRVSIQ